MKKRAKSVKAMRKTRGRARKQEIVIAPTVWDRYEGAFQTWGDRSWLSSSVQDARFDADGSTRLELLRRSRYWDQNSWLAVKLKQISQQYTVGPAGLKLVPNVPGAEAFNQAAAKWFDNWSKFPDYDSSQPFGVIQQIMHNSWWVDGECFIYKTFSGGLPRIQLIEAHRIGTPPDMRGREGRDVIDGVQFDLDENGTPTGRPLQYWLRVDQTANQMPPWSTPPATMGIWEPIPADQIIHLFDPLRPGMKRGLPRMTPVMNDIHDLEDFQMLEMKAAKAAAEIANVVTNKTGEANSQQLRRQKMQIQSQDAAGNPVTKTNPFYYEVTMGGRTTYFVNGEKIEQFKSDRPSIATQWYWDYLVRKVCAGVGISALFVMPFSLQGTVTRADLDIATSFFRSRSAIIAAVLREIYIWAMSWAVKFDRNLKMDGIPKEWWHVHVRPPRAPNVDVGRNSAAIISEVNAGIRTFQDVCAEMGHDWRQMMDQKAAEADYINQLLKKYPGVTRDQISQLVAKATSPEGPEPAPEPKPKPEPDPQEA